VIDVRHQGLSAEYATELATLAIAASRAIS
jgi:hypothetical protein